ncbi:hypothetical protein SAMN05660284_02561 [Formivibrio citricus]|uniref:Uncharacterized protein n=1 Tax=Formivibrio citricus TaxID=83765 RepID=A0A1I5D2G2_9NEIS|nr:hypothetical protein [Formivibrio citricus]SFN93399.1 hypothetical protein SAMN05660284_02561 [Formivibrio citricus]
MSALVIVATLLQLGIMHLGRRHALNRGAFMRNFAADLLAFRQRQAVSGHHVTMPVQTRLHGAELLLFGWTDPAGRAGTKEHLHHFGMRPLVILTALMNARIVGRRGRHALERYTLVGNFTANLLALGQRESIAGKDFTMTLQAAFHGPEMLGFTAIKPVGRAGLLVQIHYIAMGALVILTALTYLRIMRRRGKGHSRRKHCSNHTAFGNQF